MAKFTIKNITATVVVFGFYFLATLVLVNTATTQSILLAYSPPIIIGILATLGFHYIFTHEETFPFATVIEERQKKVEERWLKAFPHFGKVLMVLLLGIFGGPILGAFSAQFLIPKMKSKYYIMVLGGFLSGLFIAALSRGVFTIFKPLVNFLGNGS